MKPMVEGPRPRTVHVFGVMDVGGAELRTIELQRELKEFEFCFLTLSGRMGSLTSAILESGGRVQPLALSWRFPFRLYRFLRAYRPMAIDSHVATFSGFICLIAALARVPVRVAHFHSDGDGRQSTTGRRLQRRLMVGLIDRFATVVVGVSPSALSGGYRSDWQPDASHGIVPNGTACAPLWQGEPAPVSEEIGAVAGDLVLLHVGRPAAEKNRVYLPRILADVRRRGTTAQLVLVGPRDARDDADVMAVAALEGVADHVHFLGERDDIGAVMRGADVLLLTSTREGLPGVVAEAAAVGTPVVSSDVGGAVWLAEHLPDITCLPLAADMSAWSEAVLEAASRDRNRQAARREVEASQFGLATAAETHRGIYQTGRLPVQPMQRAGAS